MDHTHLKWINAFDYRRQNKMCASHKQIIETKRYTQIQYKYTIQRKHASTSNSDSDNNNKQRMNEMKWMSVACRKNLCLFEERTHAGSCYDLGCFILNYMCSRSNKYRLPLVLCCNANQRYVNKIESDWEKQSERVWMWIYEHSKHRYNIYI